MCLPTHDIHTRELHALGFVLGFYCFVFVFVFDFLGMASSSLPSSYSIAQISKDAENKRISRATFHFQYPPTRFIADSLLIRPHSRRGGQARSQPTQYLLQFDLVIIVSLLV